jgi:hypothetical protein
MRGAATDIAKAARKLKTLVSHRFRRFIPNDPQELVAISD